MKNIFIYIGIAVIIAATIVGQFTGLDSAMYIELAGFAIGLASCILGIFKKAEKKDWKLYVSVIGTVIGAMLMVFGGISENTIKTLIGLIAGVVVLVVSLLPSLIKKDKPKE